MDRDDFVAACLGESPSPCFVVDEAALADNLAILRQVMDHTGCRILMALKAFSMGSVFPLIRATLDGVCASSPDEARLGREEFGKEVHAYAAAFSDRDFELLLQVADHISFNSFAQFRRFRQRAAACGRPVSLGMRINPEHSEAPVPLYDPCAPGSRFGVRAADFDGQELAGLSGLHFHTLCEQGADALERTLAAVEARFAHLLPRFEWVNFGGGHLITRPGYNVDLLCRLISDYRDRHPRQTVYLEPGEAVALNSGLLVATVLDVLRNGVDIAVLDTSATCHMPDVLEMPYRPQIIGAGEPGELRHTYRLGGVSCLAGDVIGDYSFAEPLRPGDRLLFRDMAHYSMVKTTTFNGIRLPDLAVFRREPRVLEVVRRFGYEDFRGRLG